MTGRPDIDAIEARLKSATPGEWHASNPFDNGHWVCAERGAMVCRDCRKHDAALIAHAPTDLAAMVAYVRELEGQLITAGNEWDDLNVRSGRDMRSADLALVAVREHLRVLAVAVLGGDVAAAERAASAAMAGVDDTQRANGGGNG